MMVCTTTPEYFLANNDGFIQMVVFNSSFLEICLTIFFFLYIVEKSIFCRWAATAVNWLRSNKSLRTCDLS